MTPTQLRAFTAVVRHGSVKAAATEIGVSESAVSAHVAALRRELDDALFTRTGSGIAFTPGGLRLASRGAQLLGLQDRTVLEVKQAGAGRRLLRVAASSLFAEHAAPGLLDLFSRRAADLDVELAVHDPRTFPGLLAAREVDVALGPRPPAASPELTCTPFLNYEVVVVAAPDHPVEPLRAQTWLLGPSAGSGVGVGAAVLAAVGVPEKHQEIYPSEAAALDEAKQGRGVALALGFAVRRDLARGDLQRVTGPGLTTSGTWCALVLAGHGAAPPAAAALTRFVTDPRATQAMLRGAGVGAGRVRPAMHVTLWSAPQV